MRLSTYGLFLTFCALFTAAKPTLAAAAAPPPPMTYARMGVGNGCFVETVAFLDALHAKLGADVWARLLQWDGGNEDAEEMVGHAVGICDVRGKLWCWDINYGWMPLSVDPAKRDDVAAVGAAASARYGKLSAPNFVYRFEFDQPPGAPPASLADTGGASYRDAQEIAARLSANRPVNLVTFAYPSGGADHQSTVAIFFFHGRYCVYSPERGTTPFRRVPGTIKTITIYQAAIRRIFPGAHDFHSL